MLFIDQGFADGLFIVWLVVRGNFAFLALESAWTAAVGYHSVGSERQEMPYFEIMRGCWRRKQQNCSGSFFWIIAVLNSLMIGYFFRWRNEGY